MRANVANKVLPAGGGLVLGRVLAERAAGPYRARPHGNPAAEAIVRRRAHYRAALPWREE